MTVFLSNSNHPNHPPTSPQPPQHFKMPPTRGHDWVRVVVLCQKGQNYKKECKYCQLNFSGGCSRIRKHFIK